jgi:hypothetical protein
MAPPPEPVLASLSPISRAEAAAPPHLHQRGAVSARWGIQVGAFAQQAPAIKALAHALTTLSHPRGKVVQVLAPAHNDRYYRARIVNFTERDAEKACTVLHRQHLQCAIVNPLATQQVAENLLHHRG